MKTLFRMMALFLMLFSFAACSDDDEVMVETLAVTPANLNGTWKLTEWNGKSLEEWSPEENERPYLYITFNRKDKTYKMYEKFNSMYPSLKTGSFHIEMEKNVGYVIKGNYDFGNGPWANEYIVTDLLATGSMIWTVKGNAEDVQKFERCEKVPAEIEDAVEKSLMK